MPLIRICVILIIAIHVLPAHAQGDTSYLKALYDRCLTFDETQKDSLYKAAIFIDKRSKQLNFDKGILLSNRLLGIYKELDEDLPAAINYYLQTLTQARILQQPSYEIAALSDLGIAYKSLHRLEFSKKYFSEAIELSRKLGDYANEISNLSNLGAIYNLSGQPDKALQAYKKSQEVALLHKDQKYYVSSYNNIGNVYFFLKKYKEALTYFKKSYGLHLQYRDNDLNLYLDHLNLADTYISLGNTDSAYFYADSANYWSQISNSKEKLAEVHALYARYFARMGRFDSAYARQQLKYTLDTALMNVTIDSTVASIQEKFNAHEREEKNHLLQLDIEKEKARNRNILVALLFIVLVLILAGIALLYLRNLNNEIRKGSLLIRQQNKVLSALNEEKNDLINVVSHDLNTPFAAVELWGHLLLEESEGMNSDQIKAVEKMVASGRYGSTLIRSILDVGKIDMQQAELRQETVCMDELLTDLQQDFQPTATAKNITISIVHELKDKTIVTDRLMLRRILENLISNALKYSHENTSIQLKTFSEDLFCVVEVTDQGLGISEKEKSNLFRKYGQLTNKPTAGEVSTGMGLYIVKQLIEQLHGQIECVSTPGEGSTFSIRLPLNIDPS